jgi:hypothetical protein
MGLPDEGPAFAFVFLVLLLVLLLFLVLLLLLSRLVIPTERSDEGPLQVPHMPARCCFCFQLVILTLSLEGPFAFTPHEPPLTAIPR